MGTVASDAPGWARLASPLFDEIQASIITTDLAGVIQSCNRYAEVLYGRPSSELIARDSGAFAAAPVPVELAHEIYQALEAGGTWEGDFSVRRKDGSVVAVRTVDSPLHDDDGRLVGVVSMSLDVTDRQRAEARLRVQYELARTLGEAHSLEEASPRLLRTVCQALGWDMGAIWGLDIDSSLLRCLATWRAPESNAEAFEEVTARTTLRTGVPLPGQVWATGAPAWIADVADEPTFTRSAVAAAVGIHGGFAVPIRRGRDVLGVMEFYAPEIREPDDDLFESARRDWSIVIGDVCGKGPEAAALTGLVRYTTRAAAIQTRRPRLVLNLVNEAVLRQHPEQFCTVAYVRVRPEGEGARLTISCAGHPLPLALRSDGTVETVAVPGRVLGPFPELGAVDRLVRLHPGDALLLYTDGVTEARGPDGFFGDERLRATLQSCAGSSADDTVKTLERTLNDFHGGRPRDVIAFVVLRIPG